MASHCLTSGVFACGAPLPLVRRKLWWARPTVSFAFFFILSTSGLEAAACCGGGASIPTLITSDDRFHLSLSATQAFIVGDVNSHGKSIFRESWNDEGTETLRLASAWLFSEQWQVGAKLPLQRKSLGDENHFGLGDFTFNLNYEAFPLYLYSPWRPKIFVYAAVSLPSGTSSYETHRPDLESTGRGFYTSSGGILLSRTWFRFDSYLNFEGGYCWARSFASESVGAHQVMSGLWGVGYSLGAWRFGVALGSSYEGSKELKRAQTESGSKLVWDSVVEVAYRLSQSFALNSSYTDQSLIGPAKNVNLTRQFTASLNYRLPR